MTRSSCAESNLMACLFAHLELVNFYMIPWEPQVSHLASPDVMGSSTLCEQDEAHLHLHL